MHRSQQLCILLLLLVGVLSFVGNLGANAQRNVETVPLAARLSPNSMSIDQVSTTLTSTNETTTSFIGPPSISLSPSSASVGATIDVSGKNFSATDSTCSLSGGAVGTPSCTVSGGSLVGSFLVANVPAGSYTVTVTGSPIGDFASATLIVSGNSNSNGLSISLSTISAAVGTGVQVSGSGFSSSDTSCSLSGTPISLPTCSVYTGGSLVGSFIVANVALGSYTITATGTQAGDHASSSFTISGGSPTITLNPTSASAGSTVNISGSGFSLSDTGCSLTGGGAMKSETCSVSGGVITASFIVANAAVGSYSIAVTGSPDSDVASTILKLTSTTSQTTTTTTSTSQTSTSSTTTNQTTTRTSTNSSSTSTTMAPDFSISSSISTFALSQGANRTVTITIKPMNGFNSSITLTSSWLGSAPANITTSIGSPVTPVSNGTATSILAITAGSSASPGNFTIRVTGTSMSLSHILAPDIIVQVTSKISTTATTSTTAISTTNSTSSTSSLSSVLSSTTSLPALPAGCPVSYAISGSELAPFAERLRMFRDQSIMKTRSGEAFMILFNAWYYSFSPHLTQYVSMHPMQRTLLRYSLYPLIA
ncbi:MAG TPA: CFI-box-CTERM domain-containing protein, partial [Candidatus Acidoferrum sp.]|nr:CFI-box-CTERM domain-containing protein [Candidatus Acidoferrum sp.]